MDELEKAKELLRMACESVENQANWDKPPYSLWYYDAKKFVDPQTWSFTNEKGDK